MDYVVDVEGVVVVVEIVSEEAAVRAIVSKDLEVVMHEQGVVQVMGKDLGGDVVGKNLLEGEEVFVGGGHKLGKHMLDVL